MSPDVPPPLDPQARPAVESPAAEALRRRRADRAAQALVSPWSPTRARRARLFALVLVIVGPVLGTLFALLLVPDEPTDIVSSDEEAAAADLDITATVRSVDPSTGEMSLRLVLVLPAGSELRDEDGNLAEDVQLIVPDAVGEGVRELPGGELPGSLTVPLDLAGSRATRYPVDRYQANLVVVALVDGESAPIRFSLRSSDAFFTTTAVDAAADQANVNVELRVQRRWTVVGWAAFFVLICWLLAISAASIGWTTVVHGVASPAWSWGFLIGVLFALPQLRSALPGNPQGGSLVDFAAFYWAVGIVALTLVAMIGSWNIRVRRAPHTPDSPRP